MFIVTEYEALSKNIMDSTETGPFRVIGWNECWKCLDVKR